MKIPVTANDSLIGVVAVDDAVDAAQIVVAPVLQEHEAKTAFSQLRERPGLRQKDAAEYQSELRAGGSRVLLRRVPRGDVPDFVSEHAGELRFVVEKGHDA